jgi:hypothetical protein
MQVFDASGLRYGGLEDHRSLYARGLGDGRIDGIGLLQQQTGDDVCGDLDFPIDHNLAGQPAEPRSGGGLRVGGGLGEGWGEQRTEARTEQNEGGMPHSEWPDAAEIQ